jgi:hypothetical protein
MSIRVFQRVLAMDREEVWFRTMSAVRRFIERTAALVGPRRWRREHLRARLVAKPDPALRAIRESLRHRDWFSAHEQLGRHFATRPSSFPADAGALDRVADAVRARFPRAELDARERAAAILRGCYDVLGYVNVPFGHDPDWHLDAVSGRRAPKEFWADVPYLDPRCGDHKVTWELNRHQHWLQLGRAFRLTRDRVYYDRFVSELESWLSANPPLTGTNWASMLEVAFRSISWLWAIQLFSPAASTNDRFPWMVDLLVALDRQLEHIARNLSRYFSPNTHLTGEALALYVAGRTLPELRSAARWARLGRDVLVEETANQIAADGGHVELSGHYHRYSTDFYLLALLVASRSGDEAAAIFERSARAQAEYLRVICDDNGYRPYTGDDDGGQLFPICGRPSEDCADTLSSASAILDDPSLAIGELTEETYWLCGRAPSQPKSAARAQWPSTMLRDTGYCVSRTSDSDHLLFDVGPHGFLNGGHAHADALSVNLTVGGTPLLIDPGTATYTMDPETRDRFRSTAMHNTIVLNGRPQSQPSGPFHWASTASSRAGIAAIGNRCDYFEGSHNGYKPLGHTRVVLAIHGLGWFIIDLISGDASVVAEAHWHLHPLWRPDNRSACAVAARHARQTVEILSSAPVEILGLGDAAGLADVSPAYGRIEPSHTLRASVRGHPPHVLLTCIDAHPRPTLAGTIIRRAITREAGLAWTSSAFEIQTGQARVRLLAAIAKDGFSDAGPTAPWGCDDLLTDARLACVITHADGTSEATIVNGSRIESGRGEPLFELPGRTQLIRMAANTLAHPMH